MPTHSHSYMHTVSVSTCPPCIAVLPSMCTACAPIRTHFTALSRSLPGAPGDRRRPSSANAPMPAAPDIAAKLAARVTLEGVCGRLPLPASLLRALPAPCGGRGRPCCCCCCCCMSALPRLLRTSSGPAAALPAPLLPVALTLGVATPPVPCTLVGLRGGLVPALRGGEEGGLSRALSGGCVALAGCSARATPRGDGSRPAGMTGRPAPGGELRAPSPTALPRTCCCCCCCCCCSLLLRPVCRVGVLLREGLVPE